jgi:hypothetical protein
MQEGILKNGRQYRSHPVYSLKIFATLFGFFFIGVFTFLHNIIMTEYTIQSPVQEICHCLKNLALLEIYRINSFAT